MKKSTFLTSLFYIIFFSLTAQVTFVVDSLPDYTPPEDMLYIAGDFQGWDPGNPEFVLEKNTDDKWTITLDSTTSGTSIHFKFTRGDWARVEKGEFGEEIPDREFTYGNGDTVSIIIFNWADAGSGGNSTAAENVSIMDEAFYMPQLDRERRIWVYLPPDYDNSEDNYPVIYMHDGQNLFDTYTAFAGEWEVDETLNALFDQGYFVPIVVGIDNGGEERINEYTPWPNVQYGGGQGSLYIEFIVETLKPFIDENYRTLPGRESTAIWGSSLGGLISHYGVLKYQEVFSKAGIYSPSYWFSDLVWTFTADMGIQDELMLYQMTGSLEGGTMVSNTWLMDELLTNLGLDDEGLSTSITEGGEHNEQLWREDFEAAYLWLFHSFANSVEDHTVKNLQIYPNPAGEKVSIPLVLNQADKVFVYTISGVKKQLINASQHHSIDVSEFKTGLYFLEVINEETIYRGKFVKQ